MFRRKQEPEQGTHNTISLKCFLCQGNWNGSNKEELRKHLEKDHKVVFQIKELIELSKPGEREPAAGTYDEEQLLVGTQTRVDKNSGERMSQYFIVGNQPVNRSTWASDSYRDMGCLQSRWSKNKIK